MGTTGQSKDDDLIILSDDITTDEETFWENILDDSVLLDDTKENDSDILTFDADLSKAEDWVMDNMSEDTIIDLDDNNSLDPIEDDSDTKWDDSKIDFDFWDLWSDNVEKEEESTTEQENSLDISDSDEILDLWEWLNIPEDTIQEDTEWNNEESGFSLDSTTFSGDNSSDNWTMSSILDDTISKLSSRKGALEDKKNIEETHISELKDQVKDLEIQVSDSEEKVENFKTESKHIESNISQLEKMKEVPSDWGKKMK